MKRFIFAGIFLLVSIAVVKAKEIPLEATKVCQKCHPLIYQEFRSSMHAKASIFKDEIHKAVWQRHPAHKKGN